MKNQSDNEWITINEFTKYKNLGYNKQWQIIKYAGDLAIYSFCPHCGYTHDCYINKRDENGKWMLSCEYDPEREFKFCPMCGTDMMQDDEEEK